MSIHFRLKKKNTANIIGSGFSFSIALIPPDNRRAGLRPVPDGPRSTSFLERIIHA
jgi:hypothetical protein